MHLPAHCPHSRLPRVPEMVTYKHDFGLAPLISSLLSLDSMMYFTSVSLCCLIALPCLFLGAEGHGFVHSVVVDGKEYQGWNPFSDPYNNPSPRVTRKVGSDGFVADTDADLACHHGGDAGTTAIAEAPAGSKITFNWAYWPGDHQGPVSTYMASCGGECASFSANDAQWFKIDASGYSAEDRQWAAAKLITGGSSWTSTIPQNLAAGEYLVRHEIVALHSVTPQFYPSCTQVKVTGSGTGKPSSDELMTIQQVYAGASWPNIYLSTDLGSFVVPGPRLTQLDGSGADPDTATTTTRRPSSTTVTGTRTSATNTPSSSAATTKGSDQCVLTINRRLVRRRLAL